MILNDSSNLMNNKADITLGDYIGMTQDEAAATEQVVSGQISVTWEQEYNSNYAAGYIYKQSPVSGFMSWYLRLELPALITRMFILPFTPVFHFSIIRVTILHSYCVSYNKTQTETRALQDFLPEDLLCRRSA